MSDVERTTYDHVPGGVIYRVTEPPTLIKGTAKTKNRAYVEFHPNRRNYDFLVRLGISVGTIKMEVRRASPYGVENGGHLYGWPPTKYGATITTATDAGPDSEHKANSLTLTHPERLEAQFGEFTRRAMENGLCLVGDWHTHPSGNPQPSAPDRKAWASVLRRSGLEHYVGLIVTPSRGGVGWMSPEIHPWVVSRDGANGFVVERACLT
jgi:integrative and conjugative element protein (TIGR02256 family)